MIPNMGGRQNDSMQLTDVKAECRSSTEHFSLDLGAVQSSLLLITVINWTLHIEAAAVANLEATSSREYSCYSTRFPG